MNDFIMTVMTMETIENFFFILILSGLCFMLLQTRLLIQMETSKKPIWDFFLSFFLKQKWVRVKNMKKDQPGPLALFKFYCITLSINQKVHSPSQVKSEMWVCLSRSNIAKGTMDPRVEFGLPKKLISTEGALRLPTTQINLRPV